MGQLVNLLIRDDRYFLVKMDNLPLTIQMQLPKNQFFWDKERGGGRRGMGRGDEGGFLKQSEIVKPK